MSASATLSEAPLADALSASSEDIFQTIVSTGLDAALPPPVRREKDHAELARQTMAKVLDGLRQRETAFVVQIIELIREVSTRIDTLSVHQMADIIGRDLTTMARLMKTACTVGYNPEGVEIGSLNEAIQVIGYNRIRNMSVSLLLLQNANRKWSHDEFDDVSSVMLTSSLMAETLATHGGRRLDPDHVFLCAALRNYGKLLLASFFPDDYRDALRLIPERGEDASFREHFGMSALELARQLLEQAKLPPSLLRALDRINPKLFESEEPASRQDQQLVAIDFSVKFCELLARLKSPADFTEGYTHLLKTHGHVLSLTKEDMHRLLEDTQAKIDTFRHSMPSPVFANRVVQNLRALLEEQPLVPKPDTVRERRQRPEDELGYVHSPERTLRLGLRDLDRLLAQPPVEEGVAWALATRLLWRSLELENSLLLLRKPSLTEFEVEYGFGSTDHTFKDNGRVLAKDKTIFSVSLANSRDVVIQRPLDPAIQPFIPAWLKPLANGALLVLPITDSTGTFALLLGIARPGQTFVLSPKTMEHLLSLRKSLAQVRQPAVRHDPAAS